MNEELIVKIREQSVITRDTDWGPCTFFDSYMFAELIVKECIDQVKLELGNNTQLLSNPPQNGGVWQACNNIRKHFGVE